MFRLFDCIRLAALVGIAVTLAGCGQRVRGTYSGAGHGFFDRLTFQSGGKVEIVFMSMTKEATYEVDGKRVKVTNGGDTQVFTLDDSGCLDGGHLLGRYCKDGEAGDATLSGEFRSEHGEDGITLNFLDAQKVRVLISERGRTSDSATGTYTVDGNQVTVRVRSGQPLSLRRNGDVLEGVLDGALMKFVRK